MCLSLCESAVRCHTFTVERSLCSIHWVKLPGSPITGKLTEVNKLFQKSAVVLYLTEASSES